jgi:hypothetical protein
VERTDTFSRVARRAQQVRARRIKVRQIPRLAVEGIEWKARMRRRLVRQKVPQRQLLQAKANTKRKGNQKKVRLHPARSSQVQILAASDPREAACCGQDRDET